MKTRQVLIIDNDPGELGKHSRMLSESRFSVLEARNCAEAAGILKKRRGRAAILTGLSVEGECMVAFMKKTLEDYPFTPFLFLVSSPSPESVLDTMKAGAVDCLRRPVTREALCGSVSRSMDRMKALLEAEKQGKEIRKKLAKTRKEAQDAKTLSSFKGFMISMAAHDFRTLLTVLDGYLQFLREKCRECHVSGDEGLLNRANRTVGRLLSMTNTLLDYEAAETGRIRLEIKPFPLEETLRECMAFYSPYAGQKHVRLLLEPVSSGIMVKGDREKVMEILDNLVYNALKFTPAKGSIRLSGKKDKGDVEITVSDSGQGIPEEKLRNLFNQENMVATLDAHARLGLGMTICKKLVEAQNGKIRVNSILRKGTTVSFTLPSG